MSKKTVTSGKVPPLTQKPAKDYSFAPPLIGEHLQQRAEALGLTPKLLAAQLGIYWRSIYKIFKRKYLEIPEMIVWSKLLNENLFLLYHPNVEPKPDPRDEEIEKLRGYVKHLEGVEEENGILKNRLLKQEGRIEALEEQLEKKNGR